jgi:DNA-binding NtrC family response regulator
VQKPKARVLILARDSVIAALIGMLVEMDGYDPAFPAPGEAAEQALARLRAPIVVCVDCEIPEVQSDLFFARVARSSARVVLFGAPGAERRMKELAARRSLHYFLLPTDRASLARVLDAALQQNQASPSRQR